MTTKWGASGLGERDDVIVLAQMAALPFEAGAVREAVVHENAQTAAVAPAHQAQAAGIKKDGACSMLPGRGHFSPNYSSACYHQPFFEPMSATERHGCFDEALGIWVWTAPQSIGAPRPALFLDRDGVIIEDPGYLSRAADMQLIEGAAGLIALANRRNVPVVVVTNQAGIGRGFYGWDDFAEVEEALAEMLAREGAAVDAVFACPYHPEGITRWAHPAHPARKPGPRMLHAAERLLQLDLRRSWIVGDRLADLQAGYHAGLHGGLHVLTGAGARDRAAVNQWKPENFEVRLGDSIRDAAGLLR